MDRFNIPRVAEGLTTYAIERQHSVERHQPSDGPPWSEQRRLWTDSILQSMARLDGKLPDSSLMERYDQELKEAGGRFLIVPARRDMQRDVIYNLRAYLSALEDAGGDRRRQVGVVQELLEDMASHPHWAAADNGIDRAMDDAERILRRMAAQRSVYRAGTACQMTISVSGQMAVLKVEPGKAPECVTMPNTLQALQDAVGGYIETVSLDCGAVLICNEEGKLMGLPANRRLGGDIIAGTFLVVGEVNGEFCSLPDEDAAHYTEQFAQSLPALGEPGSSIQWEFHVF